jgi:photosystem II stability/assembly factor-like uncharacterized protein
MPDNDDLDRWLNERVTPLPPAEGTFELIKRRARNRKLRKLAVTVTTAAAVVTAGILIPRATSLTINTHSSGSVAGEQVHPSPSGGQQPNGTAIPETTSPESSATTQLPPSVPANFQPASVTFVGPRTGWVIGQAGTPGHCATQFCTSLARTDDAGQTWQGVPAPVTGAPDGPAGVGQVRFLNTEDGWAFGPELWATHDGGQTWTRIPTNGQRVVDLETVETHVFALFATCTGTGALMAGSCTTFTLETAAGASNIWEPVGVNTTNLTDNGLASGATLVLTETAGYLLSPAGDLYTGSVDGSSAWTRLPPFSSAGVCASLGPVEPDGQPQGIMLAAGTFSRLALLCTDGTAHHLLTSADGGSTWTSQAISGLTGTPVSLSESLDGTVVTATTAGISLWTPGTSAWQQASLGSAGPDDGFGYLGMTTAQQGVALPINTALHEVWMTFDGGKTWQPYPVR